MATFKDPIRTLTFEYPAGWAYDLLYSTLTDFFFARWDRPEEILVVHLRRGSVPENQSDEQWIENIRAEVGEKASLFDMDSPQGRVVAADFKFGQGKTQRVAFLRGTHADIVVEQRNADMEAHDPWYALNTIIHSVVSDANQKQSGDSGPVEFNKTIDEANQAFEKKDYAQVVQSLQDAIRIGTTAWLSSLASPGGAPELNASVRVAQAMVHLGRFNGDAFLLRDASSILRRSLRSLEAAGEATMEAAKGLVSELKEVLDSIQSELLEQADPGVSQDSAPIVSIRERGFRMAQASATAFDSSDINTASAYAETAIEDFLFLLTYFRKGRAQQIPEELLKHLADQGISDHEEQRDAIQKAREGVLFPAFNLALQVRYCCTMELKNYRGASEAAELHLPLARLIADSSPGDTSITLNLVLALMNRIGTVAAGQDKERLQDGAKYMEEAVQILDAVGDKQCRDDGWIRSHKHQTEKSLQALSRWLIAVKECGESDFESGVQSLYKKFEEAVDRLADRIIKAPADTAPGDTADTTVN